MLLTQTLFIRLYKNTRSLAHKPCRFHSHYVQYCRFQWKKSYSGTIQLFLEVVFAFFCLKKIIVSLRFSWEMYSSAVKERKKRIIKSHSDGIHFSFRKYKAVLGIAEQAMIWLVENNNSKPLCPVRQTGGGLWVHFPNSGWYYRALLASQSSHIENCTVNQNCQARSVNSYCVAKSFCRLAIKFCFVLQEVFFAI